MKKIIKSGGFDLIKSVKHIEKILTEKERFVWNENEKRKVENYLDWKYGYNMATKRALSLIKHFLLSLT